jgi:hypothetical protein
MNEGRAGPRKGNPSGEPNVEAKKRGAQKFIIGERFDFFSCLVFGGAGDRAEVVE